MLDTNVQSVVIQVARDQEFVDASDYIVTKSMLSNNRGFIKAR